jgi:hypothetical protein
MTYDLKKLFYVGYINRILENEAKEIRHVVRPEGNGERRKRIFPLLVVFPYGASHDSQ